MNFLKYTPEFLEAVDRWDGIMSAPSKESRKNINGIQVLASPFLEKYFGTAHWVTPAVWFVPVIGLLLYWTYQNPIIGLGLGSALFAAGILLWTLIEYLLHRYVFHASPGKSHNSKVQIFITHGYHHEFTNDPWRLVAPPVMSWTIGAAVVALYYLVFGANYYAPLFAGTCLGYIAYDWIHYYTHHARPKTAVGKFLRRYHMEHHFKDPTTHFGLSSPLWDLVFGTYSRPTEPTKEELEIAGTTSASKHSHRARTQAQAAS